MGFPTNRFVKAVDPNLICGICACVLDTPTLTPCGHTFCQSCIHTWLDTATASSCPECRSRMDKNSLRPILSLRNLIFSLEVTCPNKSRGCLEVMRIDSQDAHQSECLHAAVVCVACNRHIDASQLSGHRMDTEAFHSTKVQGETVGTGNPLVATRKDASNNSSKTVLPCPRAFGFSQEENGSVYSTYLLQRISALEKQIARLLDDLHEAHRKNSILYFQNRHMRENERYRRDHAISTPKPMSGVSDDYNVINSQQDVARLSLHIARYLLQKPPSVDRDKVFRSIRQCYEMQFCLTAKDSKIEHDIHMLLATAYSSNWFTGAQRILLGCWLQCVLKNQG